MIDTAITILHNAGFYITITDTYIVVSLRRAINTMEVSRVLDAAGITAQYGRIGGSVAVML